MTWTKVIVACVILLGLWVKVTQAGEIHVAVRDGELSKVEQIIKADPKQVDARGSYEGWFPLHYAVSTSNKEIVNLLIDKGANVNVSSNDGSTPLHIAARLGYKEIVELLIGKDADVNAKNINGITPLHLASQEGYEEIVKLLIAGGAFIIAKDKDGWTPLDYAKAYDHKNIVNFLTFPKVVHFKASFSGVNEKYIIVPIFYGTDRQQTGEKDFNNYYGTKRGLFSYGICEVSIPDKHVMGEIERPSLWKTIFRIKENPNNDIVLQNIKQLSDNDYFADLRECINKSSTKDAFVFVHGFCVSFADAARRTAQLAHDLWFDGAPVMYSWPSNVELSRAGYMGDEDNVKNTVVNLKKFLIQIAANTKANNIHLIAHSMGNIALTDALESIKQSAENPLFNQVILAAPDIDASVFEQNIVPAIRGTAKRITLYVSSNDFALQKSRELRQWDYPRAGEAGDGIIVINGIDTIDASRIKTDLLGHSYYAETVPLLYDIFHLLVNGLSPNKRNLRSQKKNNVLYWSFPIIK